MLECFLWNDGETRGGKNKSMGNLGGAVGKTNAMSSRVICSHNLMQFEMCKFNNWIEADYNFWESKNFPQKIHCFPQKKYKINSKKSHTLAGNTFTFLKKNNIGFFKTFFSKNGKNWKEKLPALMKIKEKWVESQKKSCFKWRKKLKNLPLSNVT